jgi:hypothetical protein
LRRKKEKQQDAQTLSGKTIHTLVKYKYYHTNAQEPFDDAFKEVNDART